MFFVIVGIATWVIWHIWQIKMELNAEKEHLERHAERDSLTEIMARESVMMEKIARREMF